MIESLLLRKTNVRIFLDAIAFAEGTDGGIYKTKNRGFDVIVGGALFSDYRDHPRRRVYLPKLKIHSTAAGRYQILASIFDHYKKTLGLPDFSPMSQDLIAVKLISECRAIQVIELGHFSQAFSMCRSRWASLPGAGYGQPEKKLAELLALVRKAGAVVVS